MSVNFTPAYMSTVNNVSTAFTDRTALSLPDMRKEILTAFHATQQFAHRGLWQPADSFSKRFPASGRLANPTYHTPGTRLLGGTPPIRAYKDITIDDRLVLSLFIDEEDEKFRSIVPFLSMYMMEMGMSIANFDDYNAAIVAILNARASATVSGNPGGTQISKPNCDTNIGALNACMWDGKNALDVNNIPGTARTLIMRPFQYNLCAASNDRMFLRSLGQNGGSIGSNVVIPDYAGWSEIVMSNNIPNSNVASNPSGAQNTYFGDFTKTVAVGFTQQAFGTVTGSASLKYGGGSTPTAVGKDTGAQFMPLDVRQVPFPDAFGDLLIASLITGHGGLRPECGIEIKTP